MSSNNKDIHTFQLGQKIISDFGYNDNKPKQMIAMPIVAHEIGHFIGLLLNNMCVEPFGIATMINFGWQNPRFSFNWTDQIFRVLKHETATDFYGQRGYDIVKGKACANTINFLSKNYDLKRFPWFIAQKTIGGIFQLLHYQKTSQTEIVDKHFDLIFSDIDDTDQESIAGAAGMDWTSVRMYCGAYQIPWDSVCLYRLELFNAIDNLAFFDKIEPIVKEYHGYNIEEYSGIDLTKLQDKLQNIIDEFTQIGSMLEIIKQVNEILLKSIKN